MTKKTEWFPRWIKPVHSGVYETKISEYYYGHQGYSLWTGEQWNNQYSTVKRASQNQIPGEQEKEWRGLEKPIK